MLELLEFDSWELKSEEWVDDDCVSCEFASELCTDDEDDCASYELLSELCEDDDDCASWELESELCEDDDDCDSELCVDDDCVSCEFASELCAVEDSAFWESVSDEVVSVVMGFVIGNYNIYILKIK